MTSIVAHRGWSGRAPENSMAAFRMAAEDPRIEWIELDVQLSKDGVPVVIHDFKLKRTAGVAGYVKDYTYAELAAMDIGAKFSDEYRGERIPSLQMVLAEFAGKVKFNIELKTAIGLYPGLELAVIELIRYYGLERDTVITSFDHYAVQRARAAASEIRGGLIVSGLPVLLKEQLRFTGADFLSLEYSFASEALVHDLFDAGCDVMVWTVNEPEAVERMVRLHPQLMICTNYPERVFPYGVCSAG